MAKIYLTDKDDFFNGGPGADTVYGLAGEDDLYGNGGNDKLHGGGDDDSIIGGNGSDRLYGDAGNDDLSDGTGNDYLWGGVGNDTIFVGYGNDTVRGGTGNDTIIDMFDQRGGGNDKIYAGDGDDYVDSSDTGRDVIWGGTGNDLLLGAGADVIDGGNGNDFVFAANAVGATSVGVVARSELTGGSGRDTFGVGFRDTAAHDVVDIKDFNANDENAQISWRAPGGQTFSVVLHGKDLGPGQTGTITGDVDEVEMTANGRDLVLSFNVNDQVIIRGGVDWLHLS